jgi:hypothetical protein
MRKYAGILLNQAGLPQAATLIQVVQAGTQVQVPLFDGQMKQVGNPVTTDDGGQYSFWIRSGVYDLLDNNNELLASGLQIFDFTNPGEWLGVWDFPKLGFTFGGPGRLNMYVLTDSRLATDAGMRIGGMHDVLESALTIIGSGGTAPPLQIFLKSDDTQPMYLFDTLGALNFGAGATFAPDVKMYRSAAQELRTDGAFVVDKKLEHKGTTLGFFGAPPVAQPVINAGTISLPANQALYDLFVALAKLGVVAVNYTVTSSGTLAVNVDMSATRFVNAIADSQSTVTLTAVGTVTP